MYWFWESLPYILVFPVVMYGWDSWTIKKAEHQIIDAFELWCWRRLLRIPWTARKSVLNIRWKDRCWSWSSNTLATWWKNWLIGKDPDAEKESRRGRGWQRINGWMVSPTQWTWVWVYSGSSWWTGKPGVLQSMGSQRIGHDWVTELNLCISLSYFSLHIRYENIRHWEAENFSKVTQLMRGNVESITPVFESSLTSSYPVPR